MKVITVNSSPRKPGLSRTALMLRHLVIGMRDAGAEVESFDIQDKTIDYCTACFACFNKKFNETELCIHQDDMTLDMLPKWKAANLVVYASPVFFHSVTAKLKTFFERTLPVYVSFNGDGAEGAYNPAQTAAHPALAFLAVSGSPEDSAFDDYAKYVQCFEPVAQIYRNGSTLMSLPFCKDRVADVLAATEEAGRELVRSLRVSEATMARIRQPLHDDAAFIAKIATAHQTLLPGHRALMTFPTEAKRALRKLPSGAPAETMEVVEAPAPASVPAPGARRRRVSAEGVASGRHDETLSRILETPVRPAEVAVPPAAAAPRDIAIIGMSGRFASAPDLDALWRVLEAGEDLVAEVTRWDLQARYAAAPDYGRAGGLLPEIDRFDALYFKIGGAEARFMDPQQRIFLEESWLALENAGYASATIEALRCGVYVGCSDGDYRDLFPRETPPQAFWGNAPSVIPARIAYYLNLHGPAIAIDTACSSALVAIHMACQSLRAGEIDMAIGGGVFVQCTPRLFDAANNAAMLSATGHCHAFDARADGFVIGEGAGAVILKRLGDALAAGDHIHAVIRASGINQDGATNGLTAPSAQSQERLIREVHDGFGIDPASIGLVEAHGTGTKLGDPIEFQALRAAFAGQRRRAACALGSIKSNIGHAGAAAGIAGLFKLLLAMRHGRIPASLHFDRPNPLLRLEESPFFINGESRDWPRTAGAPRRAAVSSFGFSGTNGHMVVEEAPGRQRRAPSAAARLVVLSGRSPEQLAAAIARLTDYLEAAGLGVDLGDLSFTLLIGRSHRRHRFACVARDPADLLTALRGFRLAARASGAPRTETETDPARLREGQAAVDRAGRAGPGDLTDALEAVAAHYRAGADLDLAPLFADGGYGRLPLPTTVFAGDHYWIQDAARPAAAAAAQTETQIQTPVASRAPEALVGEILLAPVLDWVPLNRSIPAEGAAVILAAAGADQALVQALRSELPESRVVSLEATADDAALRRLLDTAVTGIGRLVWVAPAPHEGRLSAATLLPAQEQGVTLLFRAARALLDAGHGARRLDWTLFTQQTASVHGETTCPDHAAIHGLAGSLAREVERWTLRVVDLPLGAIEPAGLMAECAGLPVDAAGLSFYARRAGGQPRQWYRRRLVPASAAATAAASPYRQGGVYVVLGGAGGIGRSWSEHVLRAVQAQVVWIGRRPLDAAIVAEQDRLAQFGPRPHYISADGENTADLRRARAEITARFGAVQGLVHSAILLRDGVVATLDLARFQEALRPKVDLSVKAIEVFASDALDFVLFFSSMIAFTPAAGQGNYAAGCAFKDAFAERLGQELACPVKIMNWGYWGEVGVVSGAAYRARMAAHGMASIAPGPAMHALETLLAQGQDQLAFMTTSRIVDIPVIDRAQRMRIGTGGMRAAVPMAASPGAEEISALRPQLSVLRDIEAAVSPLVLVQLARLRGPCLPSLQAWREQTEIFLSRAGAVPSGRPAEAVWEAWDRSRAAWRGDADRHARCELVDATMRALPDILTGRVAATDILFPDGTMRLVEGLYRRNQVADAFNRWMTQILVAEVERRAAERPGCGLRILEIGAGTGGTTAPVLDGLRDAALASTIADYTYTDVSSAFLRHGRAEFGAAYPNLSFRTLDIESPPAGQGFAEGGYDIVLAANVLHAARGVCAALRHAKSLLKSGGLLLLNELSDHTFLSHLTFGLLDSWWAAEDAGRRLPGGPALSTDAWRAALHEEGFRAIETPARNAHLFGQQIILARSDGAIRRAATLPEVTVVPPEPAPAETRPETQRGADTADIGDIESIVLQELSQILGVARDVIDADEAFADYGLDSLNAVRLAQALNRALAVTLKTSDLYSHASAARLARHIAEIRPRITVPGPAPAAIKVAQPAPAGGADIAIIGVSGRVGSAETLDDLWQALRAGQTLIGTTDRWPDEAQSGAFLADIAGFDPAFFNISGLEARYMDPQQRGFLQESWKAIEDAGYAGEAIGRLRDSEVGVFVGCYPSDYFQLIDDRAPAQAMWGAASSVIPARLSYFLDLHGPAVAVDTACSSSLVALHLACQSLISGECAVAIAGGVALHSTPRFFAFAKRAGMLSAGGQCHAFEARADGFVAGEGLGVVVLKPLAAALADGDHIHAVIRGTGINQDGASNGITAPNGEAQLRLLRKTYATAGIDPATIEVLEAHGTGTKLGDPIEFDALRAHFSASRPGSCALGSVKATVGHTLAAAGIVGLIRLLLALRHETIPPAPDFRAPNPAVALEGSPFTIPRAPQAWPARAGQASVTPRRAAISSFGFSGTNAHAIIEEAPPQPPMPAAQPPGCLFLLSAASTAQLRQLAADLLRYCRAHHPDLGAMSFTLLAGRRRLPHRLAWVAASEAELLQRLEGWLAETAPEGIFAGIAAGPAAAVEVESADGVPDLAALTRRARGLAEGRRIVWDDLFPATARRRVPLPTYPFLQDRYWVPAAEAAAPSSPSRQKPKAERSPRLLQELWRPEPLPRGESDPSRRPLILATEHTRPLAALIARQWPGSVVLDEAEALPADFDADAVIDCAGCGPVAVADLAWLRWPQALARRGEGARYLCLTRGLAVVTEADHVAAPDGRVPRAALSRMLQGEYRKLRTAHVDFALDAADAAIAAAVADELGAPGRDSAIAYRDLTRLVSHLKEMPGHSKEAAPVVLPAQSVLWVTGGTRGLGLLTARHFVATYGVRGLVLTGRRQVPPPADWPALAKRDDAQGNRCKAYLALQAQGVALQVRALDLADRDAVAQAVAAAVAELGPIAGLLHCAGAADTETVAFLRKSAEGVGRILAPKTIGLDTLWQALAGQPMHLAVLFSSVTAAVPALAVGQSDYAMANAYLDAFARHRLQRQGRSGRPRVVSLQWPNWKDSGMGEVSSQALRQSGFAAMTDREGLALLDRVLQMPPVPVVLPAITVPVAAVTGSQDAPVAPASEPAAPKLETDRPQTVWLEAWLSEHFAEELEIPLARLQPEVPFPDYGVDSILLTQIQGRLKRALGVTLDPTLLYTCPTIRSLAQWLGAHHAEAVAACLGARASAVMPSPEAAATAPVLTPAAAGIAVVGMACRFPMAADLDAYWDLLRHGGSAIAPIPARRSHLGEGVYAALLDEIDLFDPAFFGIRETDAQAMSAQARLVLEISLAAVCHAGYRPQDIKGQAIGVYLGARAAAPPADALLEAVRHPVRAVGQNYLAASVSQFFDLHGPAVVVDTACSSALVAMNNAIQAMRCGDLDIALVGGVNILDSDGPLRMFHKRGLYSDSGMFHVFDGRANGLVLGEGCGMVMLKPVEQALAAGDTIYAVVEAVAVNNDGRTAGPSAPNLDAQTAVMKAALGRSGRAAGDITHIEVNGSGSEVSDLLELKAITTAYGAERRAGCSLGSIKPNIGHPLCAEGIASFIKVVCMLHHGRLAPFLSGEQPMRHFDFATSAFSLTRHDQAWGEEKRVAAINAFADGGTNAHAILSSWGAEPARAVSRTPIPLPPMDRRQMRPPAPIAQTALSEAAPVVRNFWTAS